MQRLYDLSLMLQGTFKSIKISKSLFRDFFGINLLGITYIVIYITLYIGFWSVRFCLFLMASELFLLHWGWSHSSDIGLLKTLGSILKDPWHPKMGKIFKVIISRFPSRFKPNRPRGIRKWWSLDSGALRIDPWVSGSRFSDLSWSIWSIPTRKSRKNDFEI